MKHRRLLFLSLLVVALLVGGCGLWVWQSRQQFETRISAAPRISAEYLASVYEHNRATTGQQYDGKLIVLTGTVSGMGEGLIGDDCIHIGTSIECDVGGHFDGVARGQDVTLAGVCKGMDAYGMIFVESCSILQIHRTR